MPEITGVVCSPLVKILQDRHVVNLKSSSIGFLRFLWTCPIRSPCSLAEHRCMMPLKLLHCEVEATTCFWHLCGVRSGRIQVAPLLEVIRNGVFQSSYQKSCFYVDTVISPSNHVDFIVDS